MIACQKGRRFLSRFIPQEQSDETGGGKNKQLGDLHGMEWNIQRKDVTHENHIYVLDY